MITEKKRGVKLTIIDTCDYEDYKAICDAVVVLGYSATLVDNGNTVFEKRIQ
jgi:ABC-type Na+ transport system ATPase subunit NatA